MAEAAGTVAFAVGSVTHGTVAVEHLFAGVRWGVGDGNVLDDGWSLNGVLRRGRRQIVVTITTRMINFIARCLPPGGVRAQLR